MHEIILQFVCCSKSNYTHWRNAVRSFYCWSVNGITRGEPVCNSMPVQKIIKTFAFGFWMSRVEGVIVSDWMTVMWCEGHDQEQDSWQGRDKIIIIKHKHLGGSRHFMTISRNTTPLSSVPLNESWYWWHPAPGQEGEPPPEPGGGVCSTSILPPFMIQHKAMKVQIDVIVEIVM